MPKEIDPQLPEDPKDLYISQRRLSLRKLAELYKGVPSCGVKNLLIRCKKEGWVKLRSNFLAKKSKQHQQAVIKNDVNNNISVLKRLNKKHSERIDWLYKLNEQLIKQSIKKNPDGTTTINLGGQDLRRAIQNEKDLMELERLVHNLPMRGPGEEISDEAVNKLIDAINESAKNDWANHSQSED